MRGEGAKDGEQQWGRPSHLPEHDLLHEVEAHGIRAVGPDQRHRVQHVAQRLAHLETVLGEEAMTKHLGRGERERAGK